MKDINGKHLWPEPAMWLLGFITIFVFVPLGLTIWTLIGVGLTELFGNDIPGFVLSTVICYFILCIPGLIAKYRYEMK